jgi:hypothetical protein
VVVARIVAANTIDLILNPLLTLDLSPDEPAGGAGGAGREAGGVCLERNTLLFFEALAGLPEPLPAARRRE